MRRDLPILVVPADGKESRHEPKGGQAPIPRYAPWEKFNAHLVAQSHKRRERKLRGYQQTIGECFEKDQERVLTSSRAKFRKNSPD